MAFWNLAQVQRWFADRRNSATASAVVRREKLYYAWKSREARRAIRQERISTLLAKILSKIARNSEKQIKYHRLVWVKEETILDMDDAGWETIGRATLAALRDDGSIILWPKPQHGFNLYTE